MATKEVVSDSNDSSEFQFVLEEVSNPGASEGVVFGIEIFDELISLVLDVSDDSRNTSSSSICNHKELYHNNRITF